MDSKTAFQRFKEAEELQAELKEEAISEAREEVLFARIELQTAMGRLCNLTGKPLVDVLRDVVRDMSGESIEPFGDTTAEDIQKANEEGGYIKTSVEWVAPLKATMPTPEPVEPSASFQTSSVVVKGTKERPKSPLASQPQPKPYPKEKV